MGDIIISGASDDLVEIDGLISDEFETYGERATVFVKVDDATHVVVSTEYDRDRDGEWRIELAGNFPDATVSWVKAVGEDYPDQRIDGYRIPSYSDVLIVHMGDIAARRIDVTCEEAS